MNLADRIHEYRGRLSALVAAIIVGAIGFASDVGLIEPEDVCPPVETEATQ